MTSADLARWEPGSLAQQVPELRAAAAFLVRYRGRTRKEYERVLGYWGAWCGARRVPILGATRSHVELWTREMEDAGLSPATRALRLSALHGYYEAAVDEDLIERNPVRRVARPKVGTESPRLGLDREEARRLLASAAAAGREEHALVCLLLVDGLRVSEARGLAGSDLETVRGHRTATVTRKGGRREAVVLPPTTAAAVDELLATRSATRRAGPLFRSELNVWGIRRLIQRLAKQAGIRKRITTHDLRHAFVTAALDAGVPLHVVQDGAGHADPRTTQRYNRARHQLDDHAAYAVEAYLGDDPPIGR